MKKSSRFLSPIGNDSAVPGQAGLGSLASGGGSVLSAHKMPSSLIEKYPATQKPDSTPLVIPRPRNESKNIQLFDSYMNR